MGHHLLGGDNASRVPGTRWRSPHDPARSVPGAFASDGNPTTRRNSVTSVRHVPVRPPWIRSIDRAHMSRARADGTRVAISVARTVAASWMRTAIRPPTHRRFTHEDVDGD